MILTGMAFLNATRYHTAYFSQRFSGLVAKVEDFGFQLAKHVVVL